MAILVENGHSENQNQAVNEISEMNLYSHEWFASDIPLDLGAYQQDLHLFVIEGELEIEVEGFPISAFSGTYVNIPAKTVHKLIAYDDLHICLGLETKDLKELRSSHVSNT